jgi:hypothetical protein
MENPLRLPAKNGDGDGEGQRAAAPANPAADPLQALTNEAVHVARLNFCWGFCRWLRCWCSTHDVEANKDFANSPLYFKEPSALSCLLSIAIGAIYGLVGWPCRHEEQKAFRAFVTPTHFVVRKLVYKWLCWAPVKMDEVIPLRRVQAVDVDWCCYKTLRVYTGDRDADNQPAVTIVCLQDADALKASLQGASSAKNFTGFAIAGSAK